MSVTNKTTPLLKGLSLKKSFQRDTVFSNINLSVENHEFVTLLGSSGCGKSTLLRILGGLDSCTEGSLSTNQNLNRSFVFQEPRLLNWLNVLENTLLPLQLDQNSIQPNNHEQALNFLELLNLSASLKKFPEELSGGMKMRTAIARSLMLSPDLLLMDEPFSALDEETRFFLQTEIRRLFERSDFSIVFVTHSLEEALFISDRILIFDKPSKDLREFIPTKFESRNQALRESPVFFQNLSALRALIREIRQ